MNAPVARRLALAVLAASLAATPVRAVDDGDLDPRYGVGGGEDPREPGEDLPSGVACTPNGNCYVSSTSATVDFRLGQWDPTGYYYESKHAGFNLGGSNEDRAHDVTADAQGRLVVAGGAVDATDELVAFARFKLDPAFLGLDDDFSVDGKATQNFNGAAHGEAVAVGPSGETVVVGCYETGSAAGSDFFVLRFDVNGDPDNNFDGNGVRTLDFNHAASVNDDDCAHAVAIQPDGKIVVAGSARFNTTDYDFAVARLTTTGTLDATFFPPNGFGTIPYDLGTSDKDEANAVAIDRFGRIVVAGYAEIDTGYQPVLARLTPTGGLDSDFGIGGKFYGYEGVVAVAVDVAVLPFPSNRVIYQTPRTLNVLDDGGHFDTTFAGGGSISIEDPNATTTQSALGMTLFGGMPVIVGDAIYSDDPSTFLNRYWMAQIFGDDFESGNTNAWPGW